MVDTEDGVSSGRGARAFAGRLALLLGLALCLLGAAPAFADGQSRGAQFYAAGRWRIENPVWNVWVVFDADGGYRVFEYVWADGDGDRTFSGEYALSPDDPRIAVVEYETGRYEATPDGLRLEAGFTAEGRTALTGDYALSSVDVPFAPYILEGGSDYICASWDYSPRAGASFAWSDRDLVSTRGRKARVLEAVGLSPEPGAAPSDALTDFGGVPRLERDWIVDVVASFTLGTNRGSSVWYFVRKELYPQELLWDWVPAESLELLR